MVAPRAALQPARQEVNTMARFRLGVAGRLTAGLIGLTVLTILAASVALYGTQEFRQGFDRIALTRFGQTVAMAKLAEQSHTVASSAPRFVGARDRADLVEQAGRLDELFRRLDDAVDALAASGADPATVTELALLRPLMQGNLNTLAGLVAERHQADAAMTRAIDNLDQLAQASRRIQSRLAEVANALAEMNAGEGDIAAVEAQARVGEVIRRVTDDIGRAVNTMLRVGTVTDPERLAPMQEEVRYVLDRALQDAKELPGALAAGYEALIDSVRAEAEGDANVFISRLRALEVAHSIVEVLNTTNREVGQFVANVSRHYDALQNEIAAERADFTAFIGAIFNGLFAIGAAAVAGALAVFVFLRRRVIGRLTGLRHCMTANAEGRPVPIPAEGHDEITDMAGAFRHFVDEVGRRETALRQAKDDAEAAYAQLAAANASIREGMRYARRIQQSLLPAVDAHAGLLADVAVAWQPLDTVGGDCYWLGEVDGRCIVAVMDCTGHGVPGAFMTAIATSVFTRILQDHDAHDPARILATMNQLVRSALRQDGADDASSNDGLDAAICIVDPRTRRLSFAGANLPLLYDDGQALHLVKGDRHSLGYRDSRPDYVFTRHDLALEPGMRFYLATDGTIDQIGGSNRRLFGRRRLQDLLRASAGMGMDAQVRHLLDALAEYRGGEPRRDDLTFIGFVPRLAPPAAPDGVRSLDTVPA